MNTYSVIARQVTNGSKMPAYLPMIVFLAFVAFLLTGFGSGLGAWQPIPVYLFLCLALLTVQEHIAANRSLAHRTYTFLAVSFAVLYAGEVYFNVEQLNFTREPMTYVLLEVVLLIAFLFDTVARHNGRGKPATVSARYGDVAIDIAGLAIFFYASALLLDLLGNQSALKPLKFHIGSPPYVLVDLNTLFHLHLASPANTLDGLNLVLGLAATAVALGLLTVAGVMLPSMENEIAYATGMRSLWQMMREGVVQTMITLRLVAGPLVWLIPAFSVAAFADHVRQYFNASAHISSSILDLFNPLSPVSRNNIGLGLNTVVLGLLAVAAVVLAVAILESSADVFRRALITLRDAARSITLTMALFMYSLAAINAMVILLGITKVEPFQVGAPGLLALVIGFAVLLYESTRIESIRPHSALPRTAPLTPPQQTPRSAPQQPRTPAGSAT